MTKCGKKESKIEVVTLEGSHVNGFKGDGAEQEAEAYATDANKRAEVLGTKARYQVRNTL